MTALIVGIIVASVGFLIIAVIVRAIWRVMRGNEEMVAGGSFGHQLLSRQKEDPPD